MEDFKKTSRFSMSQWLASNPSKRWTEVFFLAYSPFWITWALLVLVPFQLYEYCESYGYLCIGVTAALPCFVLPMFLQTKADRAKPWHQKYWVKANLWMAGFGYVGNYFWTHYFFKVLGASYTMKSHRLNGIPIVMYLMTHAYFNFYHVISNIMLRKTQTSLSKAPAWLRWTAMAAVVFVLSYTTAFMETLTIAHYPYYTFVDRSKMYTVGSLFYAIYFFVSFPMFYRMDEDLSKNKWTASDAVLDGLAAAMIVTILLDTWRITFGGIVQGHGQATEAGLPWMP